jgi:hypothetical protein
VPGVVAHRDGRVSHGASMPAARPARVGPPDPGKGERP